MNTDRDYLAAGLALGGLSEDDLAEARALADTDADFRAEVAAYEDTVAQMALSDEPQPVSDTTRDAILAIPSTVTQESSAPEHGGESAGSELGVESAAAELGSGEFGTSDSRPAEATGRGDVAAGTGATPDSGDRGRAAEPVDLAEHRRRRTWLPWAAAAAAIIVIAGLGVNAWQMQQRQNALEDTLASTQQQLDDTARLMSADDVRTTTQDLDDGGSITVVSSEAEQLIHVSSRGVEPAEGTSLQMWVIGEDGPISAGLMADDAVNIADQDFSADSLFGITVEPEGGSPQPTSDPVVAIGL